MDPGKNSGVKLTLKGNYQDIYRYRGTSALSVENMTPVLQDQVTDLQRRMRDQSQNLKARVTSCAEGPGGLVCRDTSSSALSACGNSPGVFLKAQDTGPTPDQ